MATAVDEALRPILAAAGPGGLVVEVHVSLPERRPGFTTQNAERVLSRLHAHLQHHEIECCIREGSPGHAGCISSIHGVFRGLGRGSGDAGASIFLIVGADSHHDPETLLWLESHGRLRLPGNSAGFHPGEAAGCVVLMTEPTRSRYGLPSRVIVKSACTAHETNLRDSETGSFGRALSEAAGRAISENPPVDRLFEYEDYGSSKAVLNKVKQAVDNEDAFEDAILEPKTRRAKFVADQKNEPGVAPQVNVPGSCAAPRALLLIREDGGIPAALTERWCGGQTMANPVEHFDDSSDKRVRVTRRVFNYGDSVPPCRACDVILPLLLCNEEETCHS